MSKGDKTFDVAIVGATGMVGEAVRELLQQRRFPVGNLHLLAGERTAGTRLPFNGKSIGVKLLHEFDFTQVQIAIFAATDDVSANYAPKAIEAGCIVLDNSRHYVEDDDVPLVIAGVNDCALEAVNRDKRLIASPDSIVIQLWTVLKPIYDVMRVVLITVATYQAVSGQGKKAINELAKQTVTILNGKGVKTDDHNRQLAFNVLPAIGEISVDGHMKGHSTAEWRLIQQSRRITGNTQLPLNATCVQVPVFHADSMVVHIETDDPISADKVIDLLRKNHQISVLGALKHGDYATPVKSSGDENKIFVSRIRNDLHHAYGLTMWLVGDNVRKGAAFNTVQIAESLIKKFNKKLFINEQLAK